MDSALGLHCSSLSGLLLTRAQGQESLAGRNSLQPSQGERAPAASAAQLEALPIPQGQLWSCPRPALLWGGQEGSPLSSCRSETFSQIL